MFVYTTCRDCGGLLHVTNGDTVHPGCAPAPTKAERLAQEWREAVLAADTQHEAQLYTQIEELDNRPPRLLDAAVTYARWGWPVFPLKTHAKTPATRHGFKDATTDLARIKAWWKSHPEHNIGLPTGHAFDIIDIDVPHGALSLAELIAREDPLTGCGPVPDCHGQVVTASGGIHFYIKATGEGNTAGIFPGIDHRGLGGYVVAPPSTLGARGRSWSWTAKPSPVLTGATL